MPSTPSGDQDRHCSRHSEGSADVLEVAASTHYPIAEYCSHASDLPRSSSRHERCHQQGRRIQIPVQSQQEKMKSMLSVPRIAELYLNCAIEILGNDATRGERPEKTHALCLSDIRRFLIAIVTAVGSHVPLAVAVHLS